MATGHYLVTLGSRLASMSPREGRTTPMRQRYAPKIVAQILQQKEICLRPVSRCRCSCHNPTGLTAASLYLPNDIVRSRRHCLGLRRRLRFARGSLRAVRSMRSFLAVLSKFIERTAMCSRGAGQYGRACLLTCPADLLAGCPAMFSPGA